MTNSTVAFLEVTSLMMNLLKRPVKAKIVSILTLTSQRTIKVTMEKRPRNEHESHVNVSVSNSQPHRESPPNAKGWPRKLNPPKIQAKNDGLQDCAPQQQQPSLRRPNSACVPNSRLTSRDRLRKRPRTRRERQQCPSQAEK